MMKWCKYKPAYTESDTTASRGNSFLTLQLSGLDREPFELMSECVFLMLSKIL
jgi:hypothetical protein